MAPEFPPRLVVLTLQISGTSVAAQIENVEPVGEARLRARWSEVEPPAGYRAVGSGAIYVEDSSNVRFDGPRPIKLDYLDERRFRWIQGTPPDVPWVMIALVFEAGYTLRQPRPAPTSAKNSDGRVAVYWCVRGNSLGRAQIEWDVEPLTRGVDEEVGFLNSHSTLEEMPAAAGIDLDSPVDGPSADRQVQVFLCHSSGDKPKVLRLYSRLKKDGFTPWLDQMDLVAGEAWEPAIKRAVKASHVVLVCMSQASVSKTGFVQREISSVLETAEEQPEGAIFIIPVRLEVVEVPERLSRWQWVDYFKRGGYNRLLSALHKRASQVRPASTASK